MIIRNVILMFENKFENMVTRNFCDKKKKKFPNGKTTYKFLLELVSLHIWCN